MHPILLELGPLAIRTYGVFVALAMVAGFYLLQASARMRRIDPDIAGNLALVLVFSGLAGARLLYVLFNTGYYARHPFEIFQIWKGGLVFYGGFLGAAAAGAVYVRSKKLSFARVADLCAPALALAQAVGRWGCLFAGCCHGKPTEAAWAVTYRNPNALAPLGVALHPTQVYESLGDGVLALFLWRRLARGKDPDGRVFWFYVAGYAALRFIVEFFRGDDRGVMLGGWSPSQWVAVVAAVVSVSILLMQAVQHESSHASHGKN